MIYITGFTCGVFGFFSVMAGLGKSPNIPVSALCCAVAIFYGLGCIHEMISKAMKG